MRLLARALAGVALCAAAAGSFAQDMPLALEEHTWTELRDTLASGKTTILVPIGGTEQNGPHIALGKHNIRARALAHRIARELGNALVAPVVAYVPEGSIEPPTGHMRFAGTISIPGDAFERTLEAAARSLRRHGFTDVVFLGEHGGYHAHLRRVAERLNKEWAGRGRVHPVPEFYREMEHGGREDTALSLAIDSRLVREHRLPAPAPGQGFVGDPRGATAQAGREIADDIVKRSVQSIRKSTVRR